MESEECKDGREEEKQEGFIREKEEEMKTETVKGP